MQGDKFVLNLIVAGEELLLARKKSGFGAGKIVAIGGKVNSDESPQQAVIRETLEETSLKVSQPTLQAELEFFFSVQEQHMHFFVFLTTHFTGQAQESTEVIPCWYPINELPFSQMWPDACYWLPPVLEGQFIRVAFVYGANDELLDIRLS